MKILVLATDIPFPPIGGAQVRTYHLLRSLAERHRVTLVGFACNGTPPRAPPARVVAVEWRWPDAYVAMRSADAHCAARAYESLSDPLGEPWLASCYQVPAMEQTLRALCRERFDLILIEQTPMARFLPSLPRGIPRVLDLMDVHSLVSRRAAADAAEAEKPRALAEAERILRFERQAASECDLCLVASQPEAAAAKALLGLERVRIVPNGVDTSWFAPADEAPRPGELLFTGLMSYWPNAEAVRYFVAEILPPILEEVPLSRLHIVGKDPGPEIAALANGHTLVHGFVPDPRPFYRAAAVVVVPLLHGGGTRLKVLEAAASGKAIVTTTMGIEGLAFEHGRDLIVADDPAQFAAAVVAVDKDAALRVRLQSAARTAACAYDWQTITHGFCQAMDALV